MRKHAGWYFKGIPGAAAFRGRANRARTAAELEEYVRGFAGLEG